MAQFNVVITEILSRSVIVEADSGDEAEAFVWRQYNNEELVLSSEDHINTTMAAYGQPTYEDRR